MAEVDTIFKQANVQKAQQRAAHHLTPAPTTVSTNGTPRTPAQKDADRKNRAAPVAAVEKVESVSAEKTGYVYDICNLSAAQEEAERQQKEKGEKIKPTTTTTNGGGIESFPPYVSHGIDGHQLVAILSDVSRLCKVDKFPHPSMEQLAFSAPPIILWRAHMGRYRAIFLKLRPAQDNEVRLILLAVIPRKGEYNEQLLLLNRGQQALDLANASNHHQNSNKAS